jgi:xylose isomerase
MQFVRRFPLCRLKFSLAYWHTMRGDGSDPFGAPTKRWPWEDPALDPMALAHRRLDVFFELLGKLGVSYWCFHDRDIAPEGATLEESNAALDVIAAHAARLQRERGVRLLWGTASLFGHRR